MLGIERQTELFSQMEVNFAKNYIYNSVCWAFQKDY